MLRGLTTLHIRTKLILIIMMAAVLPVCLAVVVLETRGYQSYRDSQGRFFEARAQHLAVNVRDLVRQELESLNDWIMLSELPAQMLRAEAALQREGSGFLDETAEVEARWTAAGAEDPLLRGILNNDAAAELNAFRTLHGMFAEVFVTDAKGRLLASTAKTSDFLQADEDWWTRGAALVPGSNYLEGIHYDESAGVYSLDVAVPIRDRRQPDAPVIGVLKGVLNVSTLFDLAEPLSDETDILLQVIVPEGSVLATLRQEGTVPLEERIAPQALEEILQKQSGYMITKVDGVTRDLVGFAPLQISGGFSDLQVDGATPLYILVRQPAATVLVPVRQQMILLGIGGAICLFGFVVAGYLIATHKLIAPIEQMRTAVRRIADSVRLDTSIPVGMASPAVIEPLEKITTHDELEDLARDFAGMARRVLGYNEQLERDIAAKTEEISRDLQLAREFQEALMPRSFPRVPSEPALAPLSLSFRHLYKPTLSVGGDFFDVMKLGDHKAGVFIADVMGHGARSALVTAILRTLLQNLAAESEEPARFLTTLNRLFHNSISNSGDIIFVSAFYMVIDTRTAAAHFASAGHPSPFRANRQSREVEPLLQTLHRNPALGFVADASYQQWTIPISAGDVFVLFTDGVHEAYREDGEEFGLDRMREIIRSQLLKLQSDIPTAIVSGLQKFIAPAQPADDICIVSLEVKRSPVGPEGSPKAPPALALKQDA